MADRHTVDDNNYERELKGQREIPGIHVRLHGVDVKVRSRNLEILKQAAKVCDLSFSEFARMSVMKEAKRVLLQWRKDRVEIAKKIIMDEKIREQNEKIKKEFADAS
jgi:uncharacterized protein (DUF1778 family)